MVNKGLLSGLEGQEFPMTDEERRTAKVLMVVMGIVFSTSPLWMSLFA